MPAGINEFAPIRAYDKIIDAKRLFGDIPALLAEKIMEFESNIAEIEKNLTEKGDKQFEEEVKNREDYKLCSKHLEILKRYSSMTKKAAKQALEYDENRIVGDMLTRGVDRFFEDVSQIYDNTRDFVIEVDGQNDENEANFAKYNLNNLKRFVENAPRKAPEGRFARQLEKDNGQELL